MIARERQLERLSAVLLIVLLAIQLVALAKNYAYPWLGRIWHYRYAPAMARSLLMGEGYSYRSDAGDLELVEFLRSEVPEDALLVLPSRHGGRGKFTDRNYMQYFMYPRRIASCSWEWSFDQCYRLMIHEDGYLLRTEGFPQMHEPEGRMRYIPFDEDTGLYVPLESGSG